MKDMDSKNILWHEGSVDYQKRCELLNQKGIVVWFTGLSGSGKSTIAVELEKELYTLGKLSYRLDGDNIRHGLNSNLGFSTEERNENIRRIAEVAALFQDAGIITIVSLISPLRSMRKLARSRIPEGRFIEVYVKADIRTCMERDPKGLYKKATEGQIENFTGVSSSYEEPETPELVIDTTLLNIKEATDKVLTLIKVIKQGDIKQGDRHCV